MGMTLRRRRKRRLIMTVELVDGVSEWDISDLSGELDRTGTRFVVRDVARTWHVRDTHKLYISDAFLPRKGPNGIWWMLRGRLQVLPNIAPGRIYLGVRFRRGARGWFFAIGRRRKSYAG